MSGLSKDSFSPRLLELLSKDTDHHAFDETEAKETEGVEKTLMDKLWNDPKASIAGYISEIDETCRICFKYIKNKDGGRWMYFMDNTPTLFGKYYEYILEHPLDYDENSSSRACNLCVRKLKTCFSSLVEIRVTDSVLRQVSASTGCHPKNINLRTLQFECKPCKSEYIGISKFIYHYKSHLLTKKKWEDVQSDEFDDDNLNNDVQVQNVKPVNHQNKVKKVLNVKDIIYQHSLKNNPPINKNVKDNRKYHRTVKQMNKSVEEKSISPQHGFSCSNVSNVPECFNTLNPNFFMNVTKQQTSENNPEESIKHDLFNLMEVEKKMLSHYYNLNINENSKTKNAELNNLIQAEKKILKENFNLGNDKFPNNPKTSPVLNKHDNHETVKIGLSRNSETEDVKDNYQFTVNANDSNKRTVNIPEGDKMTVFTNDGRSKEGTKFFDDIVERAVKISLSRNTGTENVKDNYQLPVNFNECNNETVNIQDGDDMIVYVDEGNEGVLNIQDGVNMIVYIDDNNQITNLFDDGNERTGNADNDDDQVIVFIDDNGNEGNGMVDDGNETVDDGNEGNEMVDDGNEGNEMVDDGNEEDEMVDDGKEGNEMFDDDDDKIIVFIDDDDDESKMFDDGNEGNEMFDDGNMAVESLNDDKKTVNNFVVRPNHYESSTNVGLDDCKNSEVVKKKKVVLNSNPEGCYGMTSDKINMNETLGDNAVIAVFNDDYNIDPMLKLEPNVVLQTEMNVFELNQNQTKTRKNKNEKKKDDRVFKCKTCGEEITGAKQYLRHEYSHIKPRPNGLFQCDTCSKTFMRKQTLKKHFSVHDETRRSTCEVCGEVTLPHEMWRHKLLHIGKRYVCPVCSHGVYHRFALEDHMFRHKPPYDDSAVKSCTRCDETFAKLSELLDHLTEVHNIKKQTHKHVFPCKHCGKSFLGPKCLQKHFLQRHYLTQVEFYCNLCDEDFPNCPTFRQHLDTKHEPSDFNYSSLLSDRNLINRYNLRCKECDFTGTKGQLRTHVNHTHRFTVDTKTGEKLPAREKCHLCDKSFIGHTAVRAHITKVHTGASDKPFKCHECQERFLTHNEYMNHLQTHDGEKHFQCEVCKIWIKRKIDIIRHLCLHVKQKDVSLENAACLNHHPYLMPKKRKLYVFDFEYGKRVYDETMDPDKLRLRRPKCMKCDKTFFDEKNLSKHIRAIHKRDKVKPFKCPICNKGFPDNSSYLVHIQIHTGMKQFQCEVCDGCFQKKSDVLRHLYFHIKMGQVTLEAASFVNNYSKDKNNKERFFFKDESSNKSKTNQKK